MKIIAFSLMIVFAIYGYVEADFKVFGFAQPKVERILNRDGSPSKYTVVRQGPDLEILADHQMGDGSIRSTVIKDIDGDGGVDLAFVSGVEDENARMYFHLRTEQGMEYQAEWQEEWEESVYRIEKLTGRSIRAATKITK